MIGALDAEGFENLSVEEGADGRTLHVTFENRRYRWDVVGLGTVLGIVSAQQEGRLIITPLHTGIPMGRVEVDAADYRAFLRGEMSAEEIFSRMLITSEVAPGNTPLTHRSYGKVDLTFSPGVRLNLVTPAPPGQLHGGELFLNPGVYTTLWRGITFDGTYAYPLSNNDPAVTRAAVSVNGRLGKQGYFQAQTGRLSGDLHGFALQASHLSRDGAAHSGVRVAHAGWSGYRRELSYEAFCSWQPTARDIVATVTAGRFLEGDTGYSVRVVSAFGERSLEFFVIDTNYSRTTGAGFTVPLGWQRQAYPGPVRARFRNAFRFTYADEKPSRGGGLSVPYGDGFQVALRRLSRSYLRVYAPQMREAGLRWLPGDATK